MGCSISIEYRHSSVRVEPYNNKLMKLVEPKLDELKTSFKNKVVDVLTREELNNYYRRIDMSITLLTQIVANSTDNYKSFVLIRSEMELGTVPDCVSTEERKIIKEIFDIIEEAIKV